MRRSKHPAIAGRVIRNVALCGGTHGNELTGVTVVRRRLAIEAGRIPAPLPDDSAIDSSNDSDLPGPYPVPRLPETFIMRSLISNPEAVRRNRRYVDFDLNRSFGNTALENPHGSGYEAQRAQVLNTLLGPKGSPSPATEFIIDLHTTTARLGPTVIIRENDEFARFIAAYVIDRLPSVRVLSYLAEETVAPVGASAGDAAPLGQGQQQTPVAQAPPAGGAPGAADRPGDYPYLTEIAPHGLEIEVGAVPQGVVRAETVIWTEQIVNACIAATDAWNRDDEVSLPDMLPVYRYREAVDYPRGENGEMAGFVHPLRQDQDFTPLQPGDPLFLLLDGTSVAYEGEPGRYPVFINEAAYYEKRAAMTLCDRREINV